jgi:multidrug efflux pump subunit AcrB
MLLAALILSGFIAISVVPVNRLPEIQIPRVQVTAGYPGLSAKDIRRALTIPIEDALASVRSLQRISSTSRDGEAVIVLEFGWGTNPDQAAILVREAIDGVYPQLPEGATKPLVLSGEGIADPIAIIGIRSRTEQGQFARHVAEYELRSRLRRIEGIGMVTLVGGQKEEIQITLDPQRSFTRGVGPAVFSQLVGSEWADVSAGSAREGNRELVIVSSGKPKDLDELKSRVLPSRTGPLYSCDVGQVMLTYRERESLFIVDGQEAVALELYRRPGSNPLALARDIRIQVDEARRDLGRDADIFILYDGSEQTRKGLIELGRSAFFGALAVVLVLLFFLRSVKGSILTLLSLPISAATAVVALALTGKSLNSMSLGGLALGIGLVSDTSVIILELLERNFGLTSDLRSAPRPPQAELADLVASVAASSLGSTLTTVIVFLPVLFLPGPLGQLYADLSITLIAAVGAGWAYAQFALPSLYRSWWRKTPHDAKGRPKLERIESVYRMLLRTAFRHPARIVVFTLLSVVVGTLLLFSRPVRFNAAEGDGAELIVQVSFEPGTKLDAMVPCGEAISKGITNIPEVAAVFGRSGAEQEDILHRSSPDYKREQLEFRCLLKKGSSASVALQKIHSLVQDYLSTQRTGNPVAQVVYPPDPIASLLGLSSVYTLVLKADNPEQLQTGLVSTLTALETKTPGVPYTYRPSGQRPELNVRLKRDMAATAQVSALTVARTLQASTEGLTASNMELAGRPIDIRVKTQLEETHPIQALEALPVNEGGNAPLFLGSIATLEQSRGPAALARLDRNDVVYIDGTPRPGMEQNVARLLQEAVQEIPGLFYGDQSVFSRYQKTLLGTVVLVILLLYLYLAAQFESYSLPLLLMVSIPFGLSGAGPALALVGAGLDSGSVVGLVVLFGLVVNNTIVLYEVSKHKFDKGMDRIGAVYRGASERLIPVLTTTATTLLALVPVLISPLGTTQKSMAAAMFGGVATSTAITLILIPPLLARFISQNPEGGSHG